MAMIEAVGILASLCFHSSLLHGAFHDGMCGNWGAGHRAVTGWTTPRRSTPTRVSEGKCPDRPQSMIELVSPALSPKTGLADGAHVDNTGGIMLSLDPLPPSPAR